MGSSRAACQGNEGSWGLVQQAQHNCYGSVDHRYIGPCQACRRLRCRFREEVPIFKGRYSKDLWRQTVLLLYLCIFVSVGLKIFRFFFCGIFCCGMCSKRKSKVAKKAPNSGDKDAKKAPKPKMRK